MPELTTQTIVAGLVAAFPTAKIGADNVRMYVRALQDIPVEELERAALAYAIDGKWMPSIRELRRAVIDARLGLPSPEEAWEQALRVANEPAKLKCPDCDDGTIEGTDDDRVEVDTGILDTMELGDEFREMLLRLADKAAEPRKLCPRCEGAGKIPNPSIDALAPPVRRALDYVGGRAEIWMTDSLPVIRAQFVKAYGRFQEQQTTRASLESAGLAELAGAIQPELPRGRD